MKENPEVKGGVKIPYAAAKRSRAKMLWWSVLLLVSLPFLALLWNIVAGWFFTSSQGAVVMETYSVNARDAGIVREVLVKKGDEVREGQVVARMSRVASPAQLEQIALLRAEREALLHTGRTYYPAAASTRLVDETIAYLKREASTMRGLMEQGAATRAEVNQAEAQLRSAKAERERIVASNVRGPAQDTSAQRRAYLDSSIAYLEGHSSVSCDVTLQRAGRVDTVEAVEGQTVAAGDPLLWFADTSTARVIAYVAPKDYEKIKLDAKVRVVIPGTGRRLDAEVDKMPTTAQNIPGGLGDSVLAGMRMVNVYVKTEEPLLPDELINGLPVKVNWGIRFFR